LHGGWGWAIFCNIRGLAITGVLLESLPQGKNRILSITIYLSMGWLMMIVLKPLLAALPLVGFYWLLLGGFFVVQRVKQSVMTVS
jgi:hemolysin III